MLVYMLLLLQSFQQSMLSTRPAPWGCQPGLSEAMALISDDDHEVDDDGPWASGVDWTIPRPLQQANPPPALLSEAMAGGPGAETSGESFTLDMWPDRPVWISIKGGSNTWREWIDIIKCHDDQTPIGVDKHRVTDRMSARTAARTGDDLAKMDSICPILISHSGGRWQRDKKGDLQPPRHRLETLEPSSAGYECVSRLRGIIFTDIPEGRHSWVDIYRDETYMPPNTIGVRGDKGQVASLFRRPCLYVRDTHILLPVCLYISLYSFVLCWYILFV